MTGVNRMKGGTVGRREGNEEQGRRGIVNRGGERVEVVFENKDRGNI